MIEHVQMPWGNPDSYSQATCTGELIFTCGQLGVDPGAPDVPFEVQARTALERLVAIICAAGGGVETILKINGFLADLADFPVYDTLYREIIGVAPKPARTTVQIAMFVSPILVEVDAIAIRTTSPTHS
ncbi:MAG: 2-iminobutanoate/2-iminopropanoate deaminase [Gaiellaceae bacterium]|nr:2-iminobutanoate/2-iminopropanoate deaminase [Gaiellaceae bacterium]